MPANSEMEPIWLDNDDVEVVGILRGLFATRFTPGGTAVTCRPMIPSRIHLAPMEGLMDALTTPVVTVGCYDLCTSEFVRITRQRSPEKVFYRFGPELKSGAKTASGTFSIQLLGSNPHYMAENVKTAVRLGSPSIDLNFAAQPKRLTPAAWFGLQTNGLIFEITQAVRKALPDDIPVTVKMRFGYRDPSVCIDNALAFRAAGASELVVHARTKADGYKPPAHWHYLREIREALDIPVVANGEVWSRENWLRVMNLAAISMIGRGAVACPDLAMQLSDPDFEPWVWADFVKSLLEYWRILTERK